MSAIVIVLVLFVVLAIGAGVAYYFYNKKKAEDALADAIDFGDDVYGEVGDYTGDIYDEAIAETTGFIDDAGEYIDDYDESDELPEIIGTALLPECQESIANSVQYYRDQINKVPSVYHNVDDQKKLATYRAIFVKGACPKIEGVDEKEHHTQGDYQTFWSQNSELTKFPKIKKGALIDVAEALTGKKSKKIETCGQYLKNRAEYYKNRSYDREYQKFNATKDAIEDENKYCPKIIDSSTDYLNPPYSLFWQDCNCLDLPRTDLSGKCKDKLKALAKQYRDQKFLDKEQQKQEATKDAINEDDPKCFPIKDDMETSHTKDPYSSFWNSWEGLRDPTMDDMTKDCKDSLRGKAQWYRSNQFADKNKQRSLATKDAIDEGKCFKISESSTDHTRNPYDSFWNSSKSELRDLNKDDLSKDCKDSLRGKSKWYRNNQFANTERQRSFATRNAIAEGKCIKVGAEYLEHKEEPYNHFWNSPGSDLRNPTKADISDECKTKLKAMRECYKTSGGGSKSGADLIKHATYTSLYGYPASTKCHPVFTRSAPRCKAVAGVGGWEQHNATPYKEWWVGKY